MGRIASVIFSLLLIGTTLATDIQKLVFTGYQNLFPLPEVADQLVDVGHDGLFIDQATKRCANYCAVHGWCGAFYLASHFADGMCHLIDNQDAVNTRVEHGAGPGHVYYLKDPVGVPVSVLTDQALL